MGPKQPVAQSQELFRQPLVDMINPKHPLVKLANVIDWEEIPAIQREDYPTNEPYAIAKIAGIKLCENYNRQYGHDRVLTVIASTSRTMTEPSGTAGLYG